MDLCRAIAEDNLRIEKELYWTMAIGYRRVIRVV